MKDTLTQVGLVILGVFIVLTVILGSGDSFKNKATSVGTKVSAEITKATSNNTNATP